MSKLITPINKGNYSMETSERLACFQQNLASGWEEGYAKYRTDWVENAKNRIVSDYPLLVDIETSSLCNLKCPMCYTITDEFKNKVNATFMKEELFYKIITEIAGKVPAIRLSLRGEPTLHPKFTEFIRFAKDKGIQEVSFLTNGSKLTFDYLKKIVEADWITVSIDGVGETYESIRKPIKFDDLLENIKTIKRIKDEMHTKKPVIKIQSIWPAIKNDPTEYYQLFSPYVDQIAYNPLIDYLALDTDIVYMENFSCPQLYQRIVVGADGLVMMCSNDEDGNNIIGDANKQSIHDLWHSDKLNKVREIHSRGAGINEIPVCAKCYLPRQTVDDEFAYVEGRKFTIENYLNRKQKIGE